MKWTAPLLGVLLIAVSTTQSASASEGFKATATPNSTTARSLNRVVCVSYDSSGEANFRLRAEPRKCTFVHRNQEPFGFNTIDMKGMNWKQWGDRRARAKGKMLLNMVGPTQARVTLSKPRSQCGDRPTFTKAHFDVPKYNNHFNLPLDACA